MPGRMLKFVILPYLRTLCRVKLEKNYGHLWLADMTWLSSLLLQQSIANIEHL